MLVFKGPKIDSLICENSCSTVRKQQYAGGLRKMQQAMSFLIISKKRASQNFDGSTIGAFLRPHGLANRHKIIVQACCPSCGIKPDAGRGVRDMPWPALFNRMFHGSGVSYCIMIVWKCIRPRMRPVKNNHAPNPGVAVCFNCQHRADNFCTGGNWGLLRAVYLL